MKDDFDGDYVLDLPAAIVEHLTEFDMTNEASKALFHLLVRKSGNRSPQEEILDIISELFQTHGFSFDKENSEFQRTRSELEQIVQYQTKWYGKSSATVTFRIGVRCSAVEELYWRIRGEEGRTARQHEKLLRRSLTIERFCVLVTPKKPPHFPRFGPISFGTATGATNEASLKILRSFLERFVEPWFAEFPSVDSIFNNFMTASGRKNTLGVLSFQKALAIAISTKDEEKLRSLLREIKRQSEQSDFVKELFRTFYQSAVAIEPNFLSRCEPAI